MKPLSDDGSLGSNDDDGPWALGKGTHIKQQLKVDFKKKRAVRRLLPAEERTTECGNDML
jgi:hypothetical protein